LTKVDIIKLINKKLTELENSVGLAVKPVMREVKQLSLPILWMEWSLTQTLGNLALIIQTKYRKSSGGRVKKLQPNN
jgi:hypothetical protein